MPDEDEVTDYVQVGGGLRVHRDLLSPCPLCKENQQRIAELETGWDKAVDMWKAERERNYDLQERLDAVLNTEVPFAGGMVKIRQFGQVQKALGQK